MSKYLDPKADLTFKRVFGEHKHLVKSLLNALLPLPEGMVIEEVEYLTSENVPDNPQRKYSIVDVKCRDNYGRYFIVEMQKYWNQAFFSRTLYNSIQVYGKQLKRGESFSDLKNVYSLNLVNDIAFADYQNEYIQEYYLTNKNHPEEIHTDLSLIFVELPKYKSTNKGEQKLKDLWLKFLTEINENTIDVDLSLLENSDTKEALQIVERMAYTSDEIELYEKYWLDVSTEHTALGNAKKEGFQDGEKFGCAKGIKIGERKKAIEMAKSMKEKGLSNEMISEISGLLVEEIAKL